MAITVHCPSCSQLLRVKEELLGRQVRCPKCQTTFTAQDVGPDPTAPSDEAFEERRPGRRARLEPEPSDEEDETPADDDYEEEEPRPRRRRRRRQRARDTVAGPAIALMVVGSLALALAAVSVVLHVALGGVMMQAPPPRQGRPAPDQKAEAIGRMVGGVVGAMIGVAWGAVILAAGINMKKLQNYGLAMTGAIVAMVPCNLCCLLGLPFGIWALVALGNQHVKDAFD